LYTDPSNPFVVNAQTLLTAVEVNTFMNFEGEYARVANVFSQHTAGVSSQLIYFQNYQIGETDFSNLWAAQYQTMNNAKLLWEEYGDDRPYYRGMARVLMAMNLGLATDLYGDVPYSDAFQAATGNFTPVYDSQSNVLTAIQQLLTDAIGEFEQPEENNAELPTTDDLIFGGDINSCMRAAWTLKARYANRLSLKDAAGSAGQVVEYANNALAIDAKPNMEAVHDASTPNQWGDFISARSDLFLANKYFMDLLKSNDDPRLPYYFSKFNDEYAGVDISVELISTNASPINVDDQFGGYFATTRNYPLVTESELYFLLAEAKARLGQDASEELNLAIQSSVSYVTGGNDDGASVATYTVATKEEILVEKYKALFGQIEPYNDYRRTGIPALVPRPEAAGAERGYIPRRFRVVSEERSYNPNSAESVSKDLDVPVWWALP
jgi:hypothetical protein